MEIIFDWKEYFYEEVLLVLGIVCLEEFLGIIG